MDPDDRIGHVGVAIAFGPTLGVAVLWAGPTGPMALLAVVNLGVAVGVAAAPSAPVREIGAWWLVLTTVAGLLALGAT